MSSESAEPSRELDSCQTVLVLPIKLYLHGDLLFELYNGGRLWRKPKTAYVWVDSGLYRSGDHLFEVRDGEGERFDLEIEWERLGFEVDPTVPDRVNLIGPKLPVLHQRGPHTPRKRSSQLSFWPPLHGHQLPPP